MFVWFLWLFWVLWLFLWLIHVKILLNSIADCHWMAHILAKVVMDIIDWVDWRLVLIWSIKICMSIYIIISKCAIVTEITCSKWMGVFVFMSTIVMFVVHKLRWDIVWCLSNIVEGMGTLFRVHAIVVLIVHVMWRNVAWWDVVWCLLHIIEWVGSLLRVHAIVMLVVHVMGWNVVGCHVVWVVPHIVERVSSLLRCLAIMVFIVHVLRRYVLVNGVISVISNIIKGMGSLLWLVSIVVLVHVSRCWYIILWEVEWLRTFWIEFILAPELIFWFVSMFGFFGLLALTLFLWFFYFFFFEFLFFLSFFSLPLLAFILFVINVTHFRSFFRIRSN